MKMERKFKHECDDLFDAAGISEERLAEIRGKVIKWSMEKERISEILEEIIKESRDTLELAVFAMKYGEATGMYKSIKAMLPRMLLALGG